MRTNDNSHILKYLLFFLILLPQCVGAQLTIKGKVFNKATGMKLAAATVFVSNTSYKTITDAVGNFELQNVQVTKGDIVVHALGYKFETYNFNAKNVQFINAGLDPQIKELETVVVKTYEKDGLARWGKIFFDNFVGTTIEADNCKIINEKALRFYYDGVNGILEVTAKEPILITNKALGYSISYTLENFVLDLQYKTIYFTGYPSFTDLEGNARLDNKWRKNRYLCYQGSVMHFMRSLYANSLQKNKFYLFETLKVPAGKTEKTLSEFKNMVKIDVDIKKLVSVIAYKDSVFINKPLAIAADSLTARADTNAVLFNFDNYLLVKHFKKVSEQRGAQMTFTQSIIQIIDPNKPLVIFANGNFDSVVNMFTQLNWAKTEVIARLLPYDYDETIE